MRCASCCTTPYFGKVSKQSAAGSVFAWQVVVFALALLLEHIDTTVAPVMILGITESLWRASIAGICEMCFTVCSSLLCHVLTLRAILGGSYHLRW
jgi:hypothetical protein